LGEGDILTVFWHCTKQTDARVHQSTQIMHSGNVVIEQIANSNQQY